jgi:hypothetical protein
LGVIVVTAKNRKEPDMEAMIFVIIALLAIAALVAFDLLAARYGVDSRGSVGDDHARHAGL